MIRSPSYLVWSRTFLLGVGLTDLGHFGRYFGQNKEIVSVFNGSVVYFNVGIGLTFLGRCCSTRQAQWKKEEMQKGDPIVAIGIQVSRIHEGTIAVGIGVRVSSCM